MLVLQNILRKYRSMVDNFSEFLTKIQLDNLIEPESKSSYIWILGEFGDSLELSPYILERMIIQNKEDKNVQVSLSLLTALVKLLFTRAPEVKGMLGEFFEFLFTETKDVDVKDKAAFYYKLLQQGVDKAESIVKGEPTPIDNFFEDEDKA